MTRRLTPRHAFVAFLLGTFLAQLAWIISLPTYAGIDEFDHVYKAASVARGELMPTGPAADGRGELVAVPADIVRAAEPVCSSYIYTKHDNCHAVDQLGGGIVTVACAAARYNPAYYLVVGTVARPFHGDAANYAMRLATAIICGLLIAWAAAVVTTWSQSRWPLLALTIATTPVLIYSTAITSPNGINYAAGLLVWASLLGLVRYNAPARPALLLTSFATGSAVLVLTHTTGPLWLALICFVTFWLRTPREWWRLVRNHTRLVVGTAAVVTAFTLLSVAWTSLSGANSLGTNIVEHGALKAGVLLRTEILWVLQSIAAFPTRTERAPTPVYPLWLILMGAAVGLAMAMGRRRDRAALGTLFALVLGVPAVLTVVSYAHVGLSWQGRYGLPLTVGLFLVAGWVLDQHASPARTRIVVPLFVLTGTACAISVADVALREMRVGVTHSVAHNIPGGLVIVVALSILGSLVPVTVLLRREVRQPSTVLASRPLEPEVAR
ncbi:MAG: DUF2142 domain-containing protein [Marmoricola sp.]